MPISIKKEKVLYIHTVDFYTVIRMNELKLHTVIWVYLKNHAEKKIRGYAVL